MPTSERDRTFRVLGLPPDAKLHDSVNILSTLFDKNGQKTEPAVHSLGLDPYKFGRTVSKVATVTFARTPEILCNGKDRWNFFLDDATITIDTHFLGFTPLNSVKDDEDHKIDFIAVSGLSSHPFGSWKERGGPFMWLRDALARNPQGARVLLYGYDTGLVHSESFQDIDDIGNNLSFGIRQIRSPQPGEINFEPRPIVFIAHSLGGLVVKEAIYQMASSDPVNFQSVYGLLFFGVPNRGIEISHWLPIVDNQPNENLIRNLAPGSIYLRNLQHKFCQVFGFHDSRVVSIYETMKSKTAKQESPGVWSLTGKTDILVPRDSAVDSCPPGPRHDELGFNQNHSDLPKFSSPHEHDYRSVDYFLDDFRRDAVRVIQARFGNEGFFAREFNGGNYAQPALYERAGTPINDWPQNINPGQKSVPAYMGTYAPFVNRNMSQSPFYINQNIYMRRMQSPPPQFQGNFSRNGALAQGVGVPMDQRLRHPISADQGANMDATQMNQHLGFRTDPPRYEEQDPSLQIQKPKPDQEDTKPPSVEPLDSTFAAVSKKRLPATPTTGLEENDENNSNSKKEDLSTTCSRCKEQFRSQNALSRHLKLSGHDKDDDTTEKRNEDSLTTCRKCKKQFLSRSALLEHLRSTGHDEADRAALHAAAKDGNLEEVELLLDQGADIESKVKNDWTPLHSAASSGHLEVVKLLLDRGADIDAKEVDHWTPLYCAAKNGHLETVKLLLDRGTDIEAKSNKNWTALHSSALNGHLEVVKLLLDRGADIQAKINDNCTALHLAAENGYTEVVQLLTGRGAQIEAKDDDGWIPLHYAANKGHVQAVQLLLDRGADIEAKTNKSRTALDLSTEKEHTAVVTLLQQHQQTQKRTPAIADYSTECNKCKKQFRSRNGLLQHLRATGHDEADRAALHSAVKNGNLEEVERLLDRGADIEAKSNNDWTSLHSAASNGHLEVVKLLLDRGADIEAKEVDRWTPLYCAAKNGHLGTVNVLLDRGADIESKAKNDWIPLHSAASNGHLEVVKLLLDRGADIEAKEVDRWTPLYCAAKNGHLETVKLLLDRGADIESKAKNDWVPLHCAAFNGHLEAVRLLLDQGADIQAKINDDCSALHLAAENGHTAVVQLLIDRGAQVETKDSNSWTPLHYAANKGHVQVVQLLLDRGADIEAKTDRNRTALNYSIEKGHTAVVELLQQYQQTQKRTPAIADYSTECNKCKKQFQSRNALFQHLKATGHDGVDGAALHSAVQNGNLEEVKLLLDRGANIEAKNTDGCTPLYCAAEQGQVGILNLLLDRRADIEAKDNNSRTALYCAARHGQLDVVELLLGHSADVEARNNNNWTPLHIAASNGHLEVVRLLLDQGADINAKEVDHWTALYCAAKQGELKVVKLLLEQGADVEARTNDNCTALDIAVEKGYKAVVKLLRKYRQKSLDSYPQEEDDATSRYFCPHSDCPYGYNKFVGFFDSKALNKHMSSSHGAHPREERTRSSTTTVSPTVEELEDHTSSRYFCFHSGCPYGYDKFVGFVDSKALRKHESESH